MLPHGENSSRPQTEIRSSALCYCLGVTREHLQREFSTTGSCSSRERICALIRAGHCACSTLNPRGRCCLDEVDHAIRQLRLSEQLAPGKAIL